MNCEYFKLCGGCTLGDKTYEEQLALKIDKEEVRFKEFYCGDIDIVKSEDGAFRDRVEFRIFHKQDNISYAMSDINKKLLLIDSCSIVNKNIANIMDKLLYEIKDNELLKKRFFSVEFLVSTTNDMLITMIYHKKLDDNWIEEARKLEKKLNIKLIGRSRKQKIVISEDFVREELFIDCVPFIFHHFEGSFTQPNGKVNIQMVQWVLNNIEAKDDLCELYCGSGNFTLPLSKKFNKVLATEISKTSIKSAKLNTNLNNITNIKFIRMSSCEFVDAKNMVREFRRLKLENVVLDEYNFSTIFVDPPRAGLDDTTRSLVKDFQQIIYISCNPNTLYQDLKELTKTHTIKRFALFDQFAFTNHIECGVILTKNYKNMI
jgi:tRNA (uracil-5-)-methyltransferase